MFTHILCPIDGSECSLEALDIAARLASEQSAKLTICTVVDPSKAAAMAFGDPPMTAACFDALDEEGKLLVADAAARVKQSTTAQAVCLDGQPVESIVEYTVANACDLIVMGSHGRSGIRRALLGSVAEGVLHKTDVPVMVIRWTGRVSTIPSNVNTQKATAAT
jgi:nucleotide-binding universal stress UspA family protein